MTRLTNIADEVTALAVSEKGAERMDALATKLDTEFGPMEEIESRLVSLSQSQLDDLDRELGQDQSEIDEQSDRLEQRALALELLIQEIDSVSTTWQETRDVQTALPEALRARISQMLERAPDVSEAAQAQLNSVAAVQNDVLAMQ
ncbi:MAG: hypothetical protein E2O54_10195, partial [Gammaproteobacteria bacterium]